MNLARPYLPKSFASVALLLMLIGCGSGGGGSQATTPSAPASVGASSVAMSSVAASSMGVSSAVVSSTAFSGMASSRSSISASSISLLNSNIWTGVGFWAGSNNGSPVGTYSLVAANHPSFNQAARIVVAKPSGEVWNGQLQFPVVGALANNDVVLIHLWFRSISSADESGTAFTTLYMEGPAPDYTKFVTRDLSSTGDWQEYFIPLKVANLKPTDTVAIKFGIGAGSKAQTYEIGGLEALNYRTQVALADLPKTNETYGGRALDAPWRAAAAARIEQYRKGDFNILVEDAAGAPLANANIDIKFKRHAYHFGSVIVSNLLMGTDANSVQYREKVLDLFNQSGTENDLKWAPWIGEWGNSFNQTTTLNALQWLKDRDFYLRGHVLVWPSKRNLPNLVQSYIPAEDPSKADPAIKQVVLNHIDDITTATAAVLDEWDVLNEPFDNHDLMDAFGNGVMLDWFQRARNNLPTQKLYINDYSILSGGGRNTAHQEHYKNIIKFLVDNNAPLDGIGMQSHFGTAPTDLNRVYEILNEFTALYPNLKIRSTEFDINTEDEALQAEYTRDFLTMFFSHPNTVGVQLWGFWGGAHWFPNAAMYTQEWREKPNVLAWKKLIKEVWWNDFSGVTSVNGSFSARGFYGVYEVIVSQAGKDYRFEVDLQKEGASEFRLKLPTIN